MDGALCNPGTSSSPSGASAGSSSAACSAFAVFLGCLRASGLRLVGLASGLWAFVLLSLKLKVPRVLLG